MNPIPVSNEENEPDFSENSFSLMDDPLADVDFMSEFPSYPYDPSDDPFIPAAPVQSAASINDLSGEPNLSDGAWSWHDATLVGVERVGAAGATSYEIGCVDLYSNPQTGDLGGNYLRINSFGDVDAAADFYHDLQRTIHEQRLLPFNIAEFAAKRAEAYAHEQALETPTWTACSPVEYSAYEAIHLPNENAEDLPPPTILQNLMNGLNGLSDIADQSPIMQVPHERSSTFQALHNIGIEAEGFNPDKDPPPFFDEATNTAYWIGVFQPDRHDSSNCVASILSLARNPKTGEVEAMLAPCVPGDWDKTHQACEHLLDAVEKGGIERCFDAAEGMALAADQRELWEKERGLSLEPDAADELADYARVAWEIDL